MTRRRPRPPSRPVPKVETWQRPEALPADEERVLFERAVEAIDGRVLRSPLVGKGGDESAAGEAAPRSSRRVARRAKEEAPPATLDLHGCDRTTALERLARFLAAQPRGGTALVIHGRGHQILANAVARFLDRHSGVGEHVEAPPRWGGPGARLVTMR
ncbi:MAG TPA: Smr/MutS family protein [Thermoanaerobaculia bacterium]|nr:Smr/MutS family protein [Thermoanaerobaculia bacterium]